MQNSSVVTHVEPKFRSESLLRIYSLLSSRVEATQCTRSLGTDADHNKIRLHTPSTLLTSPWKLTSFLHLVNMHSLIYSPEYFSNYEKHKIQANKAFKSVHVQRSFLDFHLSSTHSPYPEFPKRDCDESKACHISITARPLTIRGFSDVPKSGTRSTRASSLLE